MASSDPIVNDGGSEVGESENGGQKIAQKVHVETYQR